MSRFKPALKYGLTLLIVGCVGYFFWRALDRNWASLHSLQLSPNYLFVALSVAVLPAGTVCSTWAWHASVKSLARGSAPIRFAQSFATVNTSSLTRYVPGKVWAFALQVYLLASLGFSKSLVFYVNVLNLGVALITHVLLGLLCWLIASDTLVGPVSLALAVLLTADVLCVLFSGPVLNFGVRTVNRVLKRKLSYFQISPGLMLELHVAHFAAAALSGLAAFLLCFGVGYQVGVRQGVLVTSASLISEVAGYLAFVVPGGLGVREGLMFAMLGGAASGPIAVMLPLAVRVISMVSDIVVGAVALGLSRGWPRTAPVPAAEADSE